MLDDPTWLRWGVRDVQVGLFIPPSVFNASDYEGKRTADTGSGGSDGIFS